MEHHMPPLVLDLALVLGAGALVTLLFRKIKQPLVLGYVIAGFLIGPHLKILPTVSEIENIETLAQLGVIFLLFGLGLEFSFKKLIRVGGSASISASVEIVFITITGYFTGKLLGWSTMDCLFLGGMLASSSTTIIIRAFDELGVKSKPFARVVFGILVVEDIVVILLMVLLSTIAVTQHIEGSELLFTGGKLLFFLILWFVSGIYLIPTLLKKVKKQLDDEGYLILSLALCLMMVVIAIKVGFSAELGAFIMGSILAETTSAEKIEHITKPVKDLFGVIFFVSIGMLIDPVIIFENIWVVLIITVLVIVGKVFSTGLGALLAGNSLQKSTRIGMSMAQIGEFAFIVAALGMSLGVISETLFPVAVGVSAITTFTTPYMIKYSDNFYQLLTSILPKQWLARIEQYSSTTQTIQAESKWRQFMRSINTTVITNGIISLALISFGVGIIFPIATKLMSQLNPLFAQITSLIVTLLLASPFLWAILFKYPKNMDYRALWENEEYKNGPLLIIIAVRFLFAITLTSYLTIKIFSIYSFFIVPIIILTLYLASKEAKLIYSKLEKQFMLNYRSRELNTEEKKGKNIIRNEIIPHENFSSWNINLIDLEVEQDTVFAGLSLEELNWRNRFGINVVYIKRGEHLLYVPQKDERVLPLDHIGITATDEELETFLPIFNKNNDYKGQEYKLEDIVIKKIVANKKNKLVGLQLKDSKIREKTDGLVIGIERSKEHFLNPKPETVFMLNDIIWIVGNRTKLNALIDLNDEKAIEQES